MATTSTSLDAAAIERRARLAKLRSLKRKQPSDDTPAPLSTDPADGDAPPPIPPSSSSTTTAPPADADRTSQAPATSLARPAPDADADDVGAKYLSGRNYDPAARGPKLGFEHAPAADADTVERRAADIARAARDQAAEDKRRAEQQALDLLALQPKKPNWDLKRDLARRMEPLHVRTENAIARLVRARIAAQKAGGDEGGGGGEAEANGEGKKAGGEGGLAGGELVEGIHQREREEEEEKRREREAEEEDWPT